MRPPARAVANALQTRQESWRSLGEEYHARCRGEAQHPAGVHCVPSWFAGNSRTLLGHILYCGPKVTSFAFHLLMMVGMNYALSLHDPSSSLLGDSDLLASCFRFYDERLRANRFHALEIGAVVLVSPMIRDFNILEEGLGLHFQTLLVHADPRAKVVGLPTSANGTWAWPVLQLRRAYWKLSVVRYPFAYRSWAHPPKFEDMSHCFGGDTTSGTRVYNSSVLRRLLSSSQQSAQLGSAWMLGLDLRLKSHKGTAITCVNSGGTILEEESYLLHTTLGASLARSQPGTHPQPENSRAQTWVHVRQRMKRMSSLLCRQELRHRSSKVSPGHGGANQVPQALSKVWGSEVWAYCFCRTGSYL